MDVWCAIRTYPKHALELGNPIPQEPVFFMKAESCIVPFSSIDSCEGDVHHEVELVLRIGENGMPDAMAVGLDLTKRSVQDKAKEKGLPWAEAKAFQGSAVLGDWVDYDPSVTYNLKINGELKQSGSLNEMSWTPGELLDKLKAWAEIKAGDILYTGTPSGVGPLMPGDELTASLYINGDPISSHSAICS